MARYALGNMIDIKASQSVSNPTHLKVSAIDGKVSGLCGSSSQHECVVGLEDVGDGEGGGA